MALSVVSCDAADGGKGCGERGVHGIEFHGNFHTSQYSKPVDPVHVAIPLRPDRPRDGAPLSTLRLLEDAKVQQTVAQTRIQPGSDLPLIGGILRDLVGEDVAITGLNEDDSYR